MSNEEGMFNSIEETMEQKQGPMKIYMWLLFLIVVICIYRSYSNPSQASPVGQYYY